MCVESDCGGTGLMECFCAGDFCACEMQGTAPCPGCNWCIEPAEGECNCDCWICNQGYHCQGTPACRADYFAPGEERSVA